MRRINYKKLLELYMGHVLACESITFIDDGVFDIKKEISDNEYKTLKDIESKLKLELK
jgi:hypothetical protein